ncbi:MAG TPA: hypothetical protein VLV78_10625 [Thermoanaerobaculia bacterium]|nr:hypothetical protein [Thermoanaerobaculia bacterium]
MTFYNVLSALLFVGSLRVLLLAFEASAGIGAITAAGCLAVVVFNDMLSTSHEIESTAQTKYTLPLMIIDLINFVLLALGMVVINPQTNVFDVALPKIAAKLGASSFWLLLAIYWLLLMLWTHIACGETRKQTATVVLWQSSVVAIFLLEWIFYLCDFQGLSAVVSTLILIYLVLYLTWIRTRVRRASGLD